MTGTSGEPPTTSGRRSAPRSGAAADQTRLVRRYLSAIEVSRPGRATRRAREAVTSRIAKVDELLVSADPLARVHLTQERIELQTEQVRLGNGSQVDLDQLERDFVRVARSYSDRHGLTYAAWRQVGVATDVLDQAGIFRADRKPAVGKREEKAAKAETPEKSESPETSTDGGEPAAGGQESVAETAAGEGRGAPATAAPTTTMTSSPSEASTNGASVDHQAEAVQPAQAKAEEAGRDRAVAAENPLPLESPDDLAAAGRSSRPGASPSSGT
ncbi:MAG: hypothetical protein KY447_11710 [Actinobacteria bacterium]|nr:hypothetical protein [Actinomycetota bacterium]MBW3643569.1 hypothetical protein [Actinomycetota bacterium]